MLDSAGFAALSLRSVAAQAGVTPNTLYTYFDDMADLRNQLGDAFLARLDLPLLEAGPPRQALRVFLRDVLAVFDGARDHVALLASQRIAGPNSLALNEALLSFFVERAGHSPARAASITLFLTEWVHGRILISPNTPITSSFSTAMSRLDLQEYPRTTDMLAGPVDDSALELLIEAFAPGLRWARLRSACPAGPADAPG